MSNPAEDSRHHRRRTRRAWPRQRMLSNAACEPIVLEAGDRVGHAVRQWSHVRMFSPWTYNVDKAAERLLRGDRLERARSGALSDGR